MTARTTVAAAEPTAMDAPTRLLGAIARAAHAGFLAEGGYFFEEQQIAAMCAETGTTAHEASVVIRQLEAQYLIVDQGARFFKALPGLALLYEEAFARDEFYRQNALRRELLGVIAAADREGKPWAEFEETSHVRPIEKPQTEIFAAAMALEWLGLAKVHFENPRSFPVAIEVAGLELLADEQELDRVLPVSVSADADAYDAVASDALASVIHSCEEMLRRRCWDNAARELARGDKAYERGDWVGAIREYYMAVESGLKYRLDGSPSEAAQGRALRKLASSAAAARIIPDNYVGIFSFLDSIRSPRSHGAGPAEQLVEVGPAEALLMGNHARALLLYLGHRPPQ